MTNMDHRNSNTRHSVPTPGGRRSARHAETPRHAGAAHKAPKPHARAQSPAHTSHHAAISQGAVHAYRPAAEAQAHKPAAQAPKPAAARMLSARRPSKLNSTSSTPQGAIIVVALLVLAVLGGFVFWSNRKVDITLNGKATEVRIGSTLEDVISEGDVQVKPGNLVSVSGNVLEEGKGSAYSAKVNDADMSGQDAGSFHVQGGEKIEIGDGSDKIEDYDATEETTQPKLRMEGGAGAIAYVKQWGMPGKVETRTGKQSGETATVTVSDPQDCVIYLHNVKPDNDRKIVALTFDDGPSTYTKQYLDILNQYGARATFFNLGNSVKNMPDASRAIVEQGSQVASHTTSHKDLATLDAAGLQSELSTAFQAIQDADGVTTTIFRPPYGSYNIKCWLSSGGIASASIIWNIDSVDWKRPGADAIVQSCTTNVKPGSIILMHDGGGNRDQDVEALPTIIKTLQDQGYEFVTIDELMQSDSSIPADIATGSATMPEGAVWPTEIAS